MGIPGKINDPRITAEVEKIIYAAGKNNVAAGLLVQSAEEALFWISKGIRCITYSSESGILLSAYETALSKIKTR